MNRLVVGHGHRRFALPSTLVVGHGHRRFALPSTLVVGHGHRHFALPSARDDPLVGVGLLNDSTVMHY
jgi:hypothetical protein